MKPIAFCALLLMISITALAKDDGSTVQSSLKAVTLYRSGAELVHTDSATLKEGDNTRVVETISDLMYIKSIQVKPPAAITILGVEFSNEYLAPAEKSPREKML